MEAQQAMPVSDTGFVPLADNTLLIVDDDRAFLARLARAMETRGFEVEAAASVEDGLTSLKRRPRRSPWWTCGSTTATASTSSPP